MQRYFFDLKEPCGTGRDDVGVCLEDLAEAQREALRGLADLIRDRLAESKLDELVMEVRDEKGTVIIRTSATFRQEFLTS